MNGKYYLLLTVLLALIIAAGCASAGTGDSTSKENEQLNQGEKSKDIHIRGEITQLTVPEMEDVDLSLELEVESTDPDQPVSDQDDVKIKPNKKWLGTILVEGELESDTTYDKASLSIYESTKIYRLDDGQLITAAMDDLKLGTQVEVEMTGPVAESYPVQAKAGTVYIIAETGDKGDNSKGKTE